MAPIGFIQNELDLKFLVLYIMARTAGPITFLQLLELALCDAGVDYFSLTKAVEHMVETGQLSKEGDRYSITEKGVRNSQICESSLPYSVPGCIVTRICQGQRSSPPRSPGPLPGVGESRRDLYTQA